jgi:hypothetical protein
MSYWFSMPGIRERAPIGSASIMKTLSSTFSVPRLFIGVNSIPENGGGVVAAIAPSFTKKRAFIVTDAHIVDLAERVATSLKAGKFETTIWDKTPEEVPMEDVKICGDAMKEFQPDLIVAVGGGSVIDMAKAASIMYANPQVTDMRTFNPMMPISVKDKVRLLAVPTTSGTGSEVTGAAVLTDKIGGRKVPIGGREIFPDFVALDPNLTLGMPPKLTAGTGLDAFAHAIDCVTSPASTDITDALALKSIELIFKYLPKAYSHPKDREARLKMHIAACLAGIAFGNAACTLTHAMGHALGNVFHIHHGVAVGVLIPCTQQYFAVVSDKYLDVCKTLDIKGRTNEAKLANLIKATKDLFTEVGVPTDLKGLGITKEQLDSKMKKLVNDSLEDPDIFGSPRWLNEDQCEKLFRYAWEGKDVDF